MFVQCGVLTLCQLLTMYMIESFVFVVLFFFQAEDGIRDLVRSRGLGDVYKRQLQNPSLYNPRRFPKRCEERRNIVLEIMYKNQYITKNKKDSLVAMPLDMSSFKTSTQSEGPAPYFRAELTKFIKNLFEKENIRKSDGSEYNIYTDGLKIYTTIDLTYQKYAEEVVLNHMKWNQQRLFNLSLIHI